MSILYSDDKALEYLEQRVLTNPTEVAFNLMEDIIWLKEDLEAANDIIVEIYKSGIPLGDMTNVIREYLKGENL